MSRSLARKKPHGQKKRGVVVSIRGQVIKGTELKRLVAMQPHVADIGAMLQRLESRIEAISTRETCAHLNTLNHGRLDVRRPLAVTVEEHDGEFGAHWTEAALFAVGESQVDALQALREQIVEAYVDMHAEAERGRLGGYAAKLWALLQDLVVERAGSDGTPQK